MTISSKHEQPLQNIQCPDRAQIAPNEVRRSAGGMTILSIALDMALHIAHKALYKQTV